MLNLTFSANLSSTNKRSMVLFYYDENPSQSLTFIKKGSISASLFVATTEALVFYS